jgi:hypothetical protein
MARLLLLLATGCVAVSTRMPDKATTGDETGLTPDTGTPSATTGTPSGTTAIQVGMQTATDLGVVNSGNQGIADFVVHVKPGDTELMLFAWSDSYVSIEYLKGPDGATIVKWQDWNGSNDLTEAWYGYYADTVFSWPMRDVDAPLVPGDYVVGVATTDRSSNYVDDVDVHATLRMKQDPDFSQGHVDARIVYTGGLDADPEVVRGVEGAVVWWKQIWGAAGLTVDVTYDVSTASASLPYPGNGTEITDISEDLSGQQIEILIGEQVAGSAQIYGISGGIPGPLDPSPRAGVAVSYLVHAGQNGTFDDDEIRLMGETFAHEGGHYIGLEHPVQGGYYEWDAIDDTPECTNRSKCEAQLANNLMYPFSVGDGHGGYVHAELITPNQAAEINRAAAAL